MKLGLAIYFLLLSLFVGFTQPITIEGEFKQWHRVILTLDGPGTSEDATDNPFSNYRLDVVFTSEQGTSYILPGYFAADGDAANTGAVAGNKWRVIFTPTETGRWTFKVAFRKGENIAAVSYKDDPGAGKKASRLDGYAGDFTIKESDKIGVDFRSPEKGLLLFDGGRYLRYEGSGNYYLKAGQGSPETFLAYDEFDDVRDLKGNFLHSYDVHKAHYQEEAIDYTWKNGKGKNMLGAINYLSQQGVNSQYVILTTLKGDGNDSWPWTDPEDFTRFDCSKLDQWNKVFSYMNDKGLLLTALLFEAENEQMLDHGEALGLERKLYYREMVARFAHLNGLVWIISEETRLYHKFPPEYNSKRMAHLAAMDPYQHAVGLHNGDINGEDYKDTPEFTYFALHASADNWDQVHSKMLYRINEAKRRGHPWVVFFDECISAQYGVKTDEDDPDHDLPRREGIWGTLMAGGGGVSWYYGYKHRQNDLYCEDFTLRENMFKQTKTAIDFFLNNDIPFWEMENRNDLVDNGRCFAKENDTYLIQLSGATFANLYLEKARTYQVKWFDPVGGGPLQDGTKNRISGKGTHAIGRPPGDPTKEWIVLIQRAENVADERVLVEEKGGQVEIEVASLPLSEGWTIESGKEDSKVVEYVVWKGEDHAVQPGSGLIEVMIKIEQEGRYVFTLTGGGGIDETASSIWIRFPNAANFYGEKDAASRIYPAGLGKTPTPKEGIGKDGWLSVSPRKTPNGKWGSYVEENYPVFVEFDEPGVYTLQLSGRSKGHLMSGIYLELLPLSE